MSSKLAELARELERPVREERPSVTVTGIESDYGPTVLPSLADPG
jgi:hypothetical protein